METKQEEIIRKARRYQKKNFLTSQFRRYYFAYCETEQIPAKDFLNLVQGNTQKTNIISWSDVCYRDVQPAIPISDYISFYEEEILNKKRLRA